MNFDTFKVGDFVKLIRKDSTHAIKKENVGVLLGLTHDLSPTRMQNYIRIHLLEVGGKIFSVIYWIDHDVLIKI